MSNYPWRGRHFSLTFLFLFFCFFWFCYFWLSNFDDLFRLICIARIKTGAYGTVYKARDTANEGQMVALKKVRVPLTEEGVPMSTLREISLLKQMEKYEHPNIVR